VTGLVDDPKAVIRLAERGAADCFEASYPLIVSHAQFRAQSVQKLLPDEPEAVKRYLDQPVRVPATTVSGFAPREFEMADHQLQWFRRIGGVVGVFLGQELIDVPPRQTTPITNNCGNSTATFALAYGYASQMLGGRGVALSSDATYREMVGPRFGAAACNSHEAGRFERVLNPGFFRTEAQAAGVRYRGVVQREPVRAEQPLLTPFTQDQLAWDYNTDGWANYGLTPDLLQDAHNLGMSGDLVTVFRSAQDYVDAWGKAERISGCNAPGGKCVDSAPRAQDCRAACAGTCPDEPNGRAGAPPAVPPRLCGEQGQRACCITEGFPCRPGLREQNRCTGDCRCSIGAGSSFGVCKPLTECGGLGQRACCALEGRACRPMLLERGSCSDSLGDCACRVGGTSHGVCRSPRTPCGGLGERACCIGEGILAGEPSCRNGVPEVVPCTGDCKCTSSALSSLGMCRPQICKIHSDCAPQDICVESQCTQGSRRCRDNHPEDCSGWRCVDSACVPPG
jgi:hypothetical protein